MTEAPGGGNRADMERRIIEKSLKDESFRQRLLDDPRAAVEEELGARLPDSVRVRAVEETADTIYLVLPSSSPLGGGGELSEQELETVAGGGSTFWGATCRRAKGRSACDGSMQATIAQRASRRPLWEDEARCAAA